MQVSWPWQRSSVSNILHHARRCFLQSRLWRECFAASKPFFLHFLLSSVPPAFSAFPFPPHSPFSVFPSFLIHFLCITPLLSTPIYSALPPPIFHKHTLYCPLLPSVTLLPSFPRSLSSSALWHFPLLLPFSPFIISLSLLRSRHLMLSVSFPLIFASHLVCHSVYIAPSVCSAVILPFNWLFKARHVIW